MNLREHSPFLAYLAACGTGEIMDERFYDESLHLISACQLAGFRHVIGTLWEVNDESCADMARFTYEEMRNGGLSDASVGLGLHKAIRNLRESWTANRKGNTRRSRRARKSEGTVGESNPGTEGAGQENESKYRLPRKVVLDESDEEDDRPLHWVPYVHFGV
jgi:CHAT domain-containing protein